MRDSLKSFSRLGSLTLACVILGDGSQAASASGGGPETCDRVARIVANETGVPANVLLAITRTETGRRSNGVLAPWPWTVNMEGKGVWFNSRQEALNYAKSHFKAGARSFDVGCFQLNYRWHGQNFTDIEHMFEPIANARYAADFLSRLYAETNNWHDAAAAYHSRTPKYAEKYKARFKKIIANLPDPGAMPVTPARKTKPLVRTATVVHENNFPLLQRGQSAGVMGSLVPRSSGSARPFLANGG
ncbi:transglycosylase SLT domain-containing protein [Shimia marina]|uniref:Transglycosylase SLT domain protein n=1 Tax=Shimia marina TaxID=321267 RepID=A0A0P1F795_9RHOB|nr:transglycosylase SLT domain-containing protein [Shimia marina]CUH51353.1 Transglycosylase SLT domain protein [Shimia marina]SFD51268.1 Transglycosylase SLT domain-containing protein [Shimia marina]